MKVADLINILSRFDQQEDIYLGDDGSPSKMVDVWVGISGKIFISACEKPKGQWGPLAGGLMKPFWPKEGA